MNSQKDYYKTLNIDENADETTIKEAFRSLAKKYHPDVNKEAGSEEKFKEINEAYETLSDPSRKNQYDQMRKMGGMGGGYNMGGFGFRNVNNQGATYFDMEDIENMFKQSRRRSIDINIKAVCRTSLKNALKGVKVPLKLSRIIGCKNCMSEGYQIIGEICKTCGGKGMTVMANSNVIIQKTCSDCNGTGGGEKIECKQCNGHGHLEIEETIAIKIPAGVNPSSVLRVKGKGNATYKNGQLIEGDLFVVVDYPAYEDGVSISDGALYITLKVPFANIVNKDTIKVNVLGIKKISLKLDPNQASGHEYEVKGEGAAEGSSAFIKVFIENPSNNIKEEDRERLSKLMKDIYGDSTTNFKPTAIQ